MPTFSVANMALMLKQFALYFCDKWKLEGKHNMPYQCRVTHKVFTQHFEGK